MIVVFGGAFNPVTIGHVEVCDYILNRFEGVKFVFLPVSSAYTKSDLASNYDRVNMLELAIGDRKNVSISEMEMRDNDFLGTYQSLIRIADKEEDDVYFVIGADNISGLEKWINVEGFLSDFKVIVLGRDTLNIKELIKGNNVLNKFESSFIIYNDFSYDVSSTKFRETFNKTMVPRLVYDYIIDNELYLGDEEDV
jgi:nicotinate-nucleotide adenylyltransferase